MSTICWLRHGGAIRRAPDIPGKELPHVHDGASLRALLLGEAEEGVASKASLTQRLAIGTARAVGMTRNADLVRKASKLWMPVGDRVVIIGGELVGLELAEFLHERDRQVVVVDTEPQFGRGLSPARRQVMLGEMPLGGPRRVARIRKAASYLEASLGLTPRGSPTTVRVVGGRKCVRCSGLA